MTKDEALKEIKKMLDYYIIEEEKLARTAMAEGRWNPGFDTNRHIFDAIEKEIKQKIDEISAKIDE